MSAPAGFLIVDKPVGVTSFSMVSLVRRLTGVRRVGHAGTLDPLASGVLPVAVGQATRFIEYLDDALKRYEATVRFGSATTTYDAEGEVTEAGDCTSLDSDRIAAALPAFTGDIEQVPPRYSAIKLAGKPLYRYAREGVDVAPAARIVHISSIELRSYRACEAVLDVVCGKGTYIRSLAHELGKALGCPAHLAALRRLNSGGFSVHLAHTPDRLAAAAADGTLDDLVLAPDRAVERRAAVIVDEMKAGVLLQGRDVALATPGDAERCRAYSVEGRFLGVLRRQGATSWHPEKVLSGV